MKLLTTAISALIVFVIVYVIMRGNDRLIARDLRRALENPSKFPAWKRRRKKHNLSIDAMRSVFSSREDEFLNEREVAGLKAFAPPLSEYFDKHKNLPVGQFIDAIEREIKGAEHRNAERQLSAMGQSPSDKRQGR